MGRHAQLVLAGLHMHHVGEDIVLWPRLLERAAPSSGLVETMQSQHQRVDDLTSQLEPVLTAWTTTGDAAQRAELAGLLAHFGQLLFEHLDLEEHEVLPLISRYISAEEWSSLGAHGHESMSARQLPLLFGSILEEADEAERTEMHGSGTGPFGDADGGSPPVPPLHQASASRLAQRPGRRSRPSSMPCRRPRNGRR